MQAGNGRNGALTRDPGSSDARKLRHKKRWFRVFGEKLHCCTTCDQEVFRVDYLEFRGHHFR